MIIIQNQLNTGEFFAKIYQKKICFCDILHVSLNDVVFLLLLSLIKTLTLLPAVLKGES